MSRLAFAAAAVLVLLLPPALGAQGPAPVVQANDNRTAGGHLAGGVLTLQLEIREARWYPENPVGASVVIPVFAEAGKAPQIPGPLIRVPAGTLVRATVRNTLADSTVTVHGLYARPTEAVDSLVLRPGDTASVAFRLDAPGTYHYSARSSRSDMETEQLAGAIVVDGPGVPANDRVFVINIWSFPVDSTRWRETLTINGKSWPYTERIHATMGDTLRWRVVNASGRNHPMHLHGFYYRVNARGDRVTDTLYTKDQQRLAVTEALRPGETMAMSWVPETPGNWLFHCHLSFHVIPEARLEPTGHGAHSGDAGEHMAGLVLGIQVHRPPGEPAAERGPARHLDVYVQEGPPPGRAPRAMSFLLGDAEGRPPAPGRVRIPGDMLVLTRDEPTDITVHNRLPEPTAIHWHGLELESWSDGVAGWSGEGARVAPPIPPGESFTARLTLKRAGTFIYHTHLNDIEQITSGLYGALLVLEPGEVYDPARDLVFVTGWDGMGHVVVNGGSTEPPLELLRGTPYQLRFINIGPAIRLRYRIEREGALVPWQRLAKDGADLPPHQALVGPATVVLDVGETFDAVFTPGEAGDYRLVVPGRTPEEPVYQRMLIVR